MLLARLISINNDSPGSNGNPNGVVAPKSNSILVLLAKLVAVILPVGCTSTEAVLPVLLIAPVNLLPMKILPVLAKSDFNRNPLNAVTSSSISLLIVVTSLLSMVLPTLASTPSLMALMYSYSDAAGVVCLISSGTMNPSYENSFLPVSVVSSLAVGESGFDTPRTGNTAPPVWSVGTCGTIGGTLSSLAMFTAIHWLVKVLPIEYDLFFMSHLCSRWLYEGSEA